VLHPPLGSSLEALRGDNGASVAIKLELGNTSVLLAADIDQDTDQDLVELFGEKLSSTVLKCPHHGSRSSNSEKFLETVSPQIAIVSTGPSEWGYPDSETIERIEQYAQEVYRTDMEGDIILSLDGEEATVKLP
jgi:competence protein ComEC